MADWTEIKIKINADDIDKASDIASMAVPYGIYIEDYRTLEEEALEISMRQCLSFVNGLRRRGLNIQSSIMPAEMRIGRTTGKSISSR